MIGLRTRMRNYLDLNKYDGCHEIVYPDNYDDFIKIKNSVIKSGNLTKELIDSRELYK